jgi:pyruvate dehydrogenase E2 component (dihydrolipoamide acetyltransferase)
MSVEIVMPKLGLTMTEGLIVEWKFNVGESVKKGEVIFVLETEKVTLEVEASADGILAKILIQENETVPVGSVIGYLAGSSEELESLMADEPGGSPKQGPVEKDETTTAQDQIMAPAPDKAGGPRTETRIKASPLARKVAREFKISLEGIKGTGPGGWIIKEDVDKIRENKSAEHPAMAIPRGSLQEDKLVPITGMRRAIARQMMASKVETAQTYMSINVDASEVLGYRKALLSEIEDAHGVRISITDIMMKVTAAAIARHPVMNTRWTEKGVLYLGDVHMGMAMALDQGLIVPVIRHINQKTFSQVAKDRVELIRKGKENSFLPDDIKGSTFTLSAMGMFGIEQFTSNINVPECAILAVGAIVEKPVVVEGDIVVRPMMNVTLSYDHRVIDGAEAGKFMRTLRNLISNPIIMYA